MTEQTLVLIKPDGVERGLVGEVIARIEGAKDQKLEGKKICIELIQQIREIEGVAGVHVMAYRQEELVSEIIVASGIMQDRAPRRSAKERKVPT